QIQQGAFPAAGRADQAHEIFLRDVERQTIEGLDRTTARLRHELLGDAAKTDLGRLPAHTRHDCRRRCGCNGVRHLTSIPSILVMKSNMSLSEITPNPPITPISPMINGVSMVSRDCSSRAPRP